MITELLEKFEDIFKPLTDEESDKRYITGKCFSCGDYEPVRYEGMHKTLNVYLCKRCLDAGAKEKFVNEDREFRDLFQPHDKKELDKRLWPRIVGAIQDWMGDEKTKDGVSADQIKNVLNAISMDDQLEEDIVEYIKAAKEDWQREFDEVHRDDIDDHED